MNYNIIKETGLKALALQNARTVDRMGMETAHSQSWHRQEVNKPTVNCVILQPSYIPWRAYFHQIKKADVFVFYDDVQYDRRGWRNRNHIKTPHGLHWLTVPVHAKGSQTQHIPIRDITISWGENWSRKHWRSLEFAYHRSPHFDRYAPILHGFYERRYERLADLTIELTQTISGLLGINDTQFIRSSTLNAEGRRTDKLLNILLKLGATRYISGPSARAYLQEEKFTAAGIALEYMKHNYLEYPQLYPPYSEAVSILDLLFMTGPDAPKYIWGER